MGLLAVFAAGGVLPPLGGSGPPPPAAALHPLSPVEDDAKYEAHKEGRSSKEYTGDEDDARAS